MAIQPTTQKRNYVKRRKKLSGVFFETALPNEYLVEIGKKDVKPVLGGKRFRMFKKFIRVPASVITLHFETNNANLDYQGIGIEGFASWRINPEDPAKAIKTLDFFDEEDPMAHTNEELKTICIEAVRHVIANMSIDDALRKKEDIAQKLKGQLREVEDKWGIIFDQVGIEKVKIMSDRLFEELQSQYRNELRLNSEKTRISTDKRISSEETAMRESVELERLETDKKINLNRLESETSLQDITLDEQQKIAEKERTIKEETFRQESTFRMEKERKNHEMSLMEKALQEEKFQKEIAFRMEQERKNHELQELEKKLKIQLQESQLKMLKTSQEIEELNSQIELRKIEIERMRREVDQTFTEGSLANALVENLPLIFESIKIDNYSILDGGKEGGLSPVTRLINEILFSVKNGGSSDLIKTLLGKGGGPVEENSKE